MKGVVFFFNYFFFFSQAVILDTCNYLPEKTVFSTHQLNLNSDHIILLLLIRIILFLPTAVGCSFHLVSQLKIHATSLYSVCGL